MMNKYVRTVFLLDETKPFAVVEPLYYAFCHGDFLLVKKNSLSFRLQVATLANGFFAFSKKLAQIKPEPLLWVIPYHVFKKKQAHLRKKLNFGIFFGDAAARRAARPGRSTLPKLQPRRLAGHDRS
jgi:hypothetical protein